ncbi:aldehyde dehydrogenase [Marivita geojedonensis]|uniref:Aldehyde dehydrogenase n=2 Tax=Marivita geojedonensis TaxID=1123756 RepID=A0A1X4NJZ2_9RHOB|nr:aldehyde dehydrogenase family protein [Marivita geojedonensis]OSQ50519.1 aldehyde dehydrogenase [Marivita geojedonensis]PRY79806.1 aldehyde dehydrogenase (NAD+) [Marivita geojedonensis]
MDKSHKYYVNGAWVDPVAYRDFEVIHPGNEEVIATIALGSSSDVDHAVAAATEAFNTWQFSTVDERVALLERMIIAYEKRSEAFIKVMSQEIGTTLSFSREVQMPVGIGHLEAAIEALKAHQFERPSLRGGSTLIDEPVGVVGMITPWNWPVNQIMIKVAPALAAGCTIVLKPSEYSPLSAIMLAEVIDEAGCPPGVFNLVNGDGPGVGEAISAHPGIHMVSFTGSTRAGKLVTKSAANSIKRVTLELGGKSPNLFFADADLDAAARISVDACFINNGQSCDAASRLLVERKIYDEVVERVTQIVENTKVDDPMKEGSHIGPVVNKKQFEHVQRLIQVGIDDGARLAAGGLGRPAGFNKGYYIRPTLFADVTNDMEIAQQEVFGPVLAILPFDTEEEAIEIANDTPYGLAAYIQSTDQERIHRVSRKLRAGVISVNGKVGDYDVPFGGYKESGNGREAGPMGFHEYLETKAITM